MNSMYIKDFDTFLSDAGILNEGLKDNGKLIKRAFIKKGPRTIKGVEVDPKEVIDKVEEAIDDLSFNFGSFFNFVSNFTIIYYWFDPECNTMCVDDHMNIYISVPFVKFGLKMDKTLIGAVIMHEILHVAYNHLNRGKRWLISQNKPLNRETAHDNNLAADIEVNLALLKKNVITTEKLVDEIHGLYLRDFAGNVPSMEVILEDEKMMQKLREMSPLKPIGGGGDDDKVIETTKEFDEGYVEMKNKISEIVNKYGPEKALEKLREIGAIDGVGAQMSGEINFDDVLNMSFLTLKKFEDFIKESARITGVEGLSTKEDGYRAAIKKALAEIESSLQEDDPEGPEGPDGPSGPTPKGPKIKTDIDDKDLIQMNLPNKKRKGKKSDGNSLPSKTNQKNDENEDGKKTDDENSGGKGDKNDIESNGALKDSIKSGGLGGDIDINYNGSKTGSFSDSKSKITKSLGETIKKDYGGDFKEIEKIIKSNVENNTAEKIEQRKKEAFARLSKDDALRKIWEEGKKSEEKYKSLWKKILKRFLQQRTRRAGVDVEDKNVKWFDTRRMTVYQMVPKNLQRAQDVQDINVYVDVSGSVWSNMELMKLIAQSLVTFLVEYKYSGINIIPWASESTGVHRVDPVSKIGKENAVNQIIDCIEKGANECGGGTSLRSACVPEIIATTFQYEKRSKKDDVHIIITDGYTSPDENGIEEYIEGCINTYQKSSSSSLAKKVVKNCIWFLYDNDSDEWKNNIKKGELVMISSKNFIPTE